MKKTCRPNYQKNALIVTLFIILVALGSLLWIVFHRQFSSQSVSEHTTGTIIADIYQNGQLVQSITLDTVEESYTFTITGENGCYNEIEVRPGGIGILSADCPDKLCVHQGFISTSLLPITCLPNHLVIQIRVTDSSDGDSALDIVTY